MLTPSAQSLKDFRLYLPVFFRLLSNIKTSGPVDPVISFAQELNLMFLPTVLPSLTVPLQE